MTASKHRWCDHQLPAARAASGHKRGEVKASLCTATMEKEIQCLCSCRHTVCRDLRAFSERKTGDGWWQLLVNNLISGSSALYLFYLPAFAPFVTSRKHLDHCNFCVVFWFFQVAKWCFFQILKNHTPVGFLQFVCGTPRTTTVDSRQSGPKRCGLNKRCWFLKTWQLNTTMHTYD